MGPAASSASYRSEERLAFRQITRPCESSQVLPRASRHPHDQTAAECCVRHRARAEPPRPGPATAHPHQSSQRPAPLSSFQQNSDDDGTSTAPSRTPDRPTRAELHLKPLRDTCRFVFPCRSDLPAIRSTFDVPDGVPFRTWDPPPPAKPLPGPLAHLRALALNVTTTHFIAYPKKSSRTSLRWGPRRARASRSPESRPAPPPLPAPRPPHPGRAQERPQTRDQPADPHHGASRPRMSARTGPEQPVPAPPNSTSSTTGEPTASTHTHHARDRGGYLTGGGGGRGARPHARHTREPEGRGRGGARTPARASWTARSVWPYAAGGDRRDRA